MALSRTFRNHISNLNHIRVSQSRRNASNGIENKFKSVIGLEIHAQLATQSKLFSSGSTDYGLPTNLGVNLFDAAIPGTLPVLNKKAVELAVATALALKCEINPVSLFDRKHYFYFDLPNGYQITQQRKPLAQNGVLEYAVFNPTKHKTPYYKTCKIKQIQLEQDSGKTVHELNMESYFIDLNRAGVPLIEIVCEPDIDDGEEAAALIHELCHILTRIGSCTCRMREGALRVDANVSVHEEGQELGVRTEVKNLGSIRGVVNAINYEIRRHIDVIQGGGKVLNETLTWDSQKKMTKVLRDKEGKHDYRFMPEPNLSPLRIIVDEDLENMHSGVKGKDGILDLRHLRQEIPVLPQEERMILLQKYGATDLIAYNIVDQPGLYKYFCDIITDDPSRSTSHIYVILTMCLLTALNDLQMNLDDCNLSSKILGEVVDLKKNKIMPTKFGSIVLKEILTGSKLSPTEIVKEMNLGYLSEEEIRMICCELQEKNPKLFENNLRNRRKTLVYGILKRSNDRTHMSQVENVLDKYFINGNKE